MPYSPTIGYYPDEKLFTFVSYALGLLVVEALCIRMYQLQVITGPVLLLGHIGLSLLTLGVIYLVPRWRWDDLRFPIFISALFIPAGPWGAGIAAFTLSVYWFYSQSQGSDWLDDIFDDSDHDYVLYERIVHGLEDLTPKQRIVSFKDIMTFGTEKQKRAAIEKMLVYFIPPFFPILKELLNDKNNSVRVHAATAITRLDRQYYEKFLELEAKTLQFPKNTDVLLSLAHHCEFCLESGMFDEDRRKKILFTALMAYMEYIQLKPLNFPVYLSFAKLHLQNNDPVTAKECLEKYFNEKQPKTLFACSLWMQALYELKEYSSLRNFAVKEMPYFSRKGKDKEVEMLELWSGFHAS
ncbi:MAG: hypothetical protein WC222_01795 [Parachlamydiales bacterium]|jgi:hypothetical protein